MMGAGDSELRDWLLQAAGVHTRFVDKVLAVLEEEEVVTLEDLALFATLPHFASSGISALNVAKICRAVSNLDAGKSPASCQQPASLRLPTMRDTAVTPPQAALTRSRAELQPRRFSASFEAAAIVLPPHAAAVRLQAAVRCLLAERALESARAAATTVQAAARMMLAQIAARRRLEPSRREVRRAAAVLIQSWARQRLVYSALLRDCQVGSFWCINSLDDLQGCDGYLSGRALVQGLLDDRKKAARITAVVRGFAVRRSLRGLRALYAFNGPTTDLVLRRVHGDGPTVDYVYCKRSTRFPLTPSEVLARSITTTPDAPATTTAHAVELGSGKPADASTSPKERGGKRGGAGKGTRHARKNARREAEAKAAAARVAALQAKRLVVEIHGVLYSADSRACDAALDGGAHAATGDDHSETHDDGFTWDDMTDDFADDPEVADAAMLGEEDA